MKMMIGVLLLAMTFLGCDSSKPAPKPLSSGKRLTDQQAKKAIKDAEANDLCSEQNLRNASEEQKNKCDPTRGVMEGVKPKPAPPKK